ncbi:MAG: F0F1 ATP synthase subunit alpha [Trueperaceae bacterium]|nr:F0F1 ATP synthase subunit alpha [Trueperaceae bacterium]
MSADPTNAETGVRSDDPASALLDDLDALEAARHEVRPGLRVDELGMVESVSGGIADVRGLPGAQVDERLRVAGGAVGIAADLRSDTVGVVLLDRVEHVTSGARVKRTRRVADVPVGPELLGRVVSPLGEPRDGGEPLRAERRLPIERPAPPILARAPVKTPLQTGIKAIDALFPIGRGQRELIIGDRQTGKTSVALASVLAQRATDVRCVWCSIGQRGAATARLVATLRRSGALAHTAVVVASSEDAPGLRWIAPFAAMSIAESLMEGGHDVLIVFDDLTQHARSYRELSLLLRRPPGREAYPGDVFYLHARLLERATQLRPDHGGGSLTALPIIETQEQNVSAFIPTNLISITDGQLLLSPHLAARGILPAVDVGRSVSRVGGKAQLPAYRTVAGPLRLAYTQFEELERFARFGADVDASTRRTLTRGRRVRAVLQQGALETIAVCEQLAILLATAEGVLDDVPERAVAAVERDLRRLVRDEHRDICERIEQGATLADDDRETLLTLTRRVAAEHARRAEEAGAEGNRAEGNRAEGAA